MNEEIGYVGKYKGHKVWFNGEFYYAVVKDKNFVIDEKKVDAELERWAPGC